MTPTQNKEKCPIKTVVTWVPGRYIFIYTDMLLSILYMHSNIYIYILYTVYTDKHVWFHGCGYLKKCCWVASDSIRREVVFGKLRKGPSKPRHTVEDIRQNPPKIYQTLARRQG